MNTAEETALNSFLSALPQEGITLRKNWNPPDCIVIDSHRAMISVNYKCHDPYGDDQRVEFLGLFITVWHPNSSLAAINDTLPPKSTVKDVEIMIEKMVEEAKKKCPHENAYRTGRGAMCDNEWYCPDCCSTYRLDTSG